MDSGTLAGTVSATTSSGVATFSSLKPLFTGTRYLIALSTSYDPVISTTFTVTEQSSPFSAIVSGSATATVGSANSYTVLLQNSYDVYYTNAVSVTMNLYGSDTTAVLQGTNPITSSSLGIATFSLSISRVGTFYLYPTVSGTTLMERALVVTVSNSGTPTSLGLTNPGSVGLGKTFSVTVSLYEGNNNIVSVSTAVTLTLSPGTLNGYSSSPTTAGVVTFSGLYISSTTPTSYTLTASASAYSLTKSVTFSASITSQLVFTMTSEPYFLKSVGTYTYTLSLTTAPQSTVTVALVSSNTGIITVSSSITFSTSNYLTPQTVTLTIIPGGVSQMQTDVTISHTLSSSDSTYTNAYALFSGCDRVSSSGVLTTTVLNTFIPGTLLFSGTFYVVEGSSSSYSIALSVAPTLQVVVNINCPSTITCATSSLTFTNGNYNTPQPVSVSGILGSTGSSASTTVSISYTLTTSDILYQNAITTSTSFIIISASSASAGIYQSSYPVINEHSTGTYTISLYTTPTSSVTITLTTSDSSVTVSPTSFALSSSSSSQTITITHNPVSYPTSMMRYYTISHSTSSVDTKYNQINKFTIAQSLPVYIMNPCTYGQYYSSSTYACVSCPLDYSCSSPISISLCSSTAGSAEYSPVGIATCLPCPPGFACNPGSTGKVACASGYYSLGSANACTQCLAGTACVSASAPPADCPLGTYSSAGETSCNLLAGNQVGFPNQSPTNCLAGTIPSAMRTHCEKCPPGHYCSSPSSRTMTPCPFGYYSSGGASVCTQCQAGHACSRTEDAGQCPDGYYALLGSGSCIECEIGYNCTGGLKSVCKGGYKVGQSSCSEGQCPAGYYCSQGLPPMPCPPGYVSNLGDGVCTNCSLGYYKNGNNCTLCPEGHFCANPVGPPIPCFFGTYSPSGNNSCYPCDSGYTCGQGSSDPKQVLCPPGFSCNDTYNPLGSIQVRWPTACGPGNYSTGGPAGCQYCVAGYYCPGATADYQKFPCPPGHYCPANSSFPTSCSAGTFNPD